MSSRYSNYSMLLFVNSNLRFVYCIIMKSEILVKFGARVRELRIKASLSQEELAFKANLHRTYIGMIERAEKNITLINIEKIAKGLGININEILNDKK
jgi:ribosome-binding protein aMBF1 (putative translation factor)